jgi:hypothetical protein
VIRVLRACMRYVPWQELAIGIPLGIALGLGLAAGWGHLHPAAQPCPVSCLPTVFYPSPHPVPPSWRPAWGGHRMVAR